MTSVAKSHRTSNVRSRSAATKGSAIVSAESHTPAKCRIFSGQDLTRKDQVTWAFGPREPNPYQLEWEHLTEAIRKDRPFNEVKRGAYDSIILESVVLHGVGAEKNPEIADEAIRYLEKGIREMLARKAMGADKPGPGVLRMTVAITGVRKSKEGLKPQHVLPVAAVFRGAQEVSGNVGTYIDTRFEGEIVDSVSAERVVAIVAKGIEDTSKRSGDVLDFEDVQPTLDRWLGQLEENLERNLAAR